MNLDMKFHWIFPIWTRFVKINMSVNVNQIKRKRNAVGISGVRLVFIWNKCFICWLMFACMLSYSIRKQNWTLTHLNQVHSSSTMTYFYLTERCLSHFTSSEFTPAEMNRKQLNMTRSDNIQKVKSEIAKSGENESNSLFHENERWPWFQIKRYFFIKWNSRWWNLSIFLVGQTEIFV